jgi:hypothetical protein
MDAYLDIETQSLYLEWDGLRYSEVQIYVLKWAAVPLSRKISLPICHKFDGKKMKKGYRAHGTGRKGKKSLLALSPEPCALRPVPTKDEVLIYTFGRAMLPLLPHTSWPLNR